MKSLPTPVAGDSVNALRPFVNVADINEFRLLLAWLVTVLRPRGPYPILMLQGEQGSAKSTTARVLRSLVDPSTTPTRSAPRDERDFMIAAKNAWVIAFDNLSGLPAWMSDALCRLATGGSFATRMLYSNDEEIVFNAMRPARRGASLTCDRTASRCFNPSSSTQGLPRRTRPMFHVPPAVVRRKRSGIKKFRRLRKTCH